MCLMQPFSIAKETLGELVGIVSIFRAPEMVTPTICHRCHA
jgi:hypothetical protein